MSSSTDNIGDAVRSDGTLKDASEIVWSYDADDSVPFPAGSTSASLPISASRRAPATVVASVRWTTRVIHPCHRYLEEDDNVELRSAPMCKTSGVKRKAASTLFNPRATRNTINVVSDDDCDSESDGGTPSPPPTELASDDYESLKAMADADNQVRAVMSPLSDTHCQEAALTRHVAWRRSGGGVGLGPSGKQLHPATPELTAWRERPADSSQ